MAMSLPRPPRSPHHIIGPATSLQESSCQLIPSVDPQTVEYKYQFKMTQFGQTPLTLTSIELLESLDSLEITDSLQVDRLSSSYYSLQFTGPSLFYVLDSLQGIGLSSN